MTKNTHIIILVCLVVILGNAGIHLFVIEAQKQTIQSLQHSVADARDKIGRQDQKQARADGTVGDARHTIDTIVAQIPEAVLFTEHAARLRDLVESNRLQLNSSLMFRPADAGVPYLLKFNTRIDALGEYPRIKSLIADILNQPGLVCFNSLRLEREALEADKEAKGAQGTQGTQGAQQARRGQGTQGAQGSHGRQDQVRLTLDLSMFFQQGDAYEGQ